MAAAFKSTAQLERCRNLVAEGKMTQEQFDASLELTGVDNLPERLHPKKDAAPIATDTPEGEVG